MSSSDDDRDDRIDGRWLVRAALAVLVRPSLWFTAVRQIVVLAAPRWWTRPPHLPLPDRAYLRFRLVTAYGDPERSPEPADVVTYLHWCRGWPRDHAAPTSPRQADSAAAGPRTGCR